MSEISIQPLQLRTSWDAYALWRNFFSRRTCWNRACYYFVPQLRVMHNPLAPGTRNSTFHPSDRAHTILPTSNFMATIPMLVSHSKSPSVTRFNPNRKALMVVRALVWWCSLQTPGNTKGLDHYSGVSIRTGAAAVHFLYCALYDNRSSFCSST